MAFFTSFIYTTFFLLSSGVEYFEFLREENTLTHHHYDMATPEYVAGEVIVKFDTRLINTTIIDDKSVRTAPLAEILVKNYDQVLDVLQKYSGSEDFEFRARKIYMQTTADTVSISRRGEMIPKPVFWNSLVIIVPEDTDIREIASALSGLEGVIYAEPNYMSTIF